MSIPASAIRVPQDETVGTGILVMIADGLSEAVCAEPAIRSLKSRFGMRSRITVCSDQGDLFRNHPAVERYGCADPRVDQREFDQTFRLNGHREAYDQDRNLVEYYAEQLGVQLVDRRPWICLDSFDAAEIRRFRLEETGRPRVAVAVGEDGSEIGGKWQSWKEIHRRIMTVLGATAIQIGPESWPILEGGVNLVGRLTCREAAAVLMDCELLICGDNGYLDLAAGVQTPVIAILDPSRLPYRMDAAWGTAFEAIDGDTDSRMDRHIHRVIQTAALYCRRDRQLNRGIEPA